MSETLQLITKAEVAARLRISERSVEKLVQARKFPPPLRLGKKVHWVESAVMRWLEQAVQAQLEWEPPKRQRRGS
jgi:prophage regulatory protein